MSTQYNDNIYPQAWLGDLPVTSRYTYGIAAERFFRALKDDGKIFGTYCQRCDFIYVPAALFCERCLTQLDEWVDVGKIGEVHTFTLLYENKDGTEKISADIIAFIKIGDGGLIHRLNMDKNQELIIGMKVEAVLKPKSERTGSILDIEYFKPI